MPARRPLLNVAALTNSHLACSARKSATTGTTQTLYVIERPFIAPLFKDNDNFDVLLGMDLLSLGRLVFEANGEFSFSFDF